MDLTPTIVPKSDQLNADDLMAGPITVTVVEVTKGSAEQPVNVVTEEFGPKRPYKPSKSMRRVMVACWGVDTSTYPGHRMTLFRDPTIRFGGEEVGGIRIAAMSHIDKTFTVALTITRGKRAQFVVQPLETHADEDVIAQWVEAMTNADTIEQLLTLWRDAGKTGVARDQRVAAAKDTRKGELTAADGTEQEETR